MNAKKIMGAVLVAFLAAALFIGAGAAAEDGTDFGTVFIYQNNTALPPGVWTLVGGTAVVTTVEVDSGKTAVMPGADFVAGTYKLGKDTVYFTEPTASYALTATIGTTPYIVQNGGNVYQGSLFNSDFKVVPANKTFAEYRYYITYPNGTALNQSNLMTSVSEKGTYKVQAIFNPAGFVKGFPDGLNLDKKNSFSFTVIGDDDAKLTASVDTAFSGELVTLTLVGTPGKEYMINFTAFDVPANQLQYLTSNGEDSYNVTIGNSGVVTFDAIANSSKITKKGAKKEAVAEIMKPKVKNGKIVVKISAPVVTVTADKESYVIGETIKLTGTSTADAEFTFNISGINYPSIPIGTVEDDTKFGKTWTAVLDTTKVSKKLDVGAYTIEILQNGEIVKTVTVNLKQPFISIISAPEVIVQGNDGKFLINAEAATEIQAFVFGTNYFKNYSIDKGIEVEDPEDLPNEFTITIAYGETEAMAAGQYFMVIQHPMYDKEFNITTGAVGKFYEEPDHVYLFDALDRQTANAAQALCDALESQNFDDMYVKYSFFIVGQDESFSISEIPSTIAQGETLTISGVDTANAGETIQVTMLSTAFAAVPKETTGSAAFILVTTEIAEDGTWEVTLDTSSLAIDEYNLAVKIQGEEADKKNVRINVVEAADEPDTPVTPPADDEPGQDEPVAPETPGFGALAALAGLGAVAVLLLRRE